MYGRPPLGSYGGTQCLSRQMLPPMTTMSAPSHALVTRQPIQAMTQYVPKAAIEIPAFGRQLLNNAFKEAQLEPMDPADYVFAASGDRYAQVLHRAALFAALARLAERFGMAYPQGSDPRVQRELMDLTFEMIFRRAADDGQGVSKTSLSRLIDEVRDSKGLARSQDAALAGRELLRDLLPGYGMAVSSADTSSGIQPGDQVHTYFLVDNRQSAVCTWARVDRTLPGGNLEICLGTGVRQLIPAAWVQQHQRQALTPQYQVGSNGRTAGHARRPSTAVSRSGVVGLENLGNSCYMNATLQCLSAIPELVNYFVRADTYVQELNPENFLGSGGTVAKEFADVLRYLWIEGQRIAWTPSRFKEAVARAAEQFSGTEQQDSQEFCTYLLDCLHEDLNRVRGKKTAVEFPELSPEAARRGEEEKVAAECWSLYLKRDASVIVDLFQGQLRSQIRCTRCGFESSKFDTFMYLSLPVVDATTGLPLSTLGQCLREFSKEERLSGAEQWFCRCCRTHVDAVKQLTIWKLPVIFLVHLKRFRFGQATRGTVMQKLGHLIDVQTQGLDLSVENALPAVSPQKDRPVFDLFGLVDHFGSTGFGHYTAVVSHSETRQWHRFDDDVINPVSEAEIKSDKAYLLFFRRRGAVCKQQCLRHPQDWPHHVQKDWQFVRDAELAA